MHFWKVLFSVVALTTAVAVAQSSSCDTPLGMELKKSEKLPFVIPDSALTASSSYYPRSLLASSARLNGDSGWCPKPVEMDTKKEYIEVDLQDMFSITAIDLQGRYAKGRGAEFADSFAVEYQTISSLGWVTYVDQSGASVFEGNKNFYGTVRRTFSPIIRARKLRIYPMTKKMRSVCIRFELYGCLEKVNEIIINAPTEVTSVNDAAANCNTMMDLDNVSPPSRSISWCSSYPVYNEMQEWIEMDFGNLRRVTAVETQGWYDSTYQYAEAYVIHYQRVNSDRWIQYKDRQDNSMFRGSSEIYTAVKNVLDPALVAKRMRVIPYDSYGRRVCMRVVLYGCDWSEAIMSYSMPQGHRFGCEDMGTPFYLYDHSYDGQNEDGHLTNGLGQLTDNIEGLSDFMADSGYGKRGFEWVGWNNETLAGAPVEMIFEFDSVRTFVLASFHVNNMFSKRAHAFRAVTLHFSVGGSNYQDDFVEYTNRRDTQNEQARTISINIAGRVGRFVKVKMYLDAMWLMVSEVRFESVANTMDGVFLTYM